MKHVSPKSLRWWAVPVIVAVLVIVVVELMSWNFLKPLIIEPIEKSTGRSAAIHGDVSVDLFPKPKLSLDEVELENAEWAASSHMFRAQRVSVSPSLIDLIQGQVVLDNLEIIGSTLNLEQRADAPANWVFGNDQTSRQAQADENARSPLDIHSLSISETDIRYRNAETETPLVVSISSLQVQADDEGLKTQATLSFRERRFDLIAQTDPVRSFVNDRQVFGGDLSLSSGESSLESSFGISGAPSLDRLQADAELSVEGIADWLQWASLPPLELDSLEVAAHLERQGSQWRISNIDAEAAESHLAGDLKMDTGGKTPTINGELRSSQLDVAALRDVLPESEEAGALSIPVLPNLRGEVALFADRLIFEEMVLRKLEAQVQLAEHAVSLDALTFDAAEGKFKASGNLTSSSEIVEADAQITWQDLNLAQLGRAMAPDDTLDGEVAVALERIEQRPTFEPDTLLSHLHIPKAHFTFRNDDAGTDLAATLESTGEQDPPTLLLNAKGTLGDKPLDMQAKGASLPSLVDLEKGSLKPDYSIEAEATSGGLYVQADTSLAAILEPQTLAADVVVDADGGEALEVWMGPVLPPLPDFRLAGHLSRDGDQWSATGLEGEVGSTSVAGSVEFLNTERAAVDVDLEAGRIDIAQFMPARRQEADEGAEDDSLLAPLRGFDGHLALNANTVVLPDGLELRELVLDADLDDGKLQAQPLEFRLGDGSVAASVALDAMQSPASGRLDIDLDSILLARLADTFTPIEDRLGRVSGELHLEMSGTLPGDRRDDLLLPFIGRLGFKPSELRFIDSQAGTELTLNIETQGTGADAQTFQVQGDGRYDGAPTSLSLRGDPLLNARDPNRPYAVDLEVNLADTALRLQGTLLRPLALEGLDLELALEGPSPQRLSRLLGIPLPQLPPYSVSGDLDLENQRWTLSDIEGVVGDSDLNGRLALDGNVSPPRVSGDLSSSHLDIEDLGFLAGATPEEIEADDRFVLPDADIITDAWQEVSADVSYRGHSVRAGNIPLSNVVIDFALEEGRGRFEPVGFGVGEGSVDLILDLDSGTQPPSGTMQVEVQGVDLNEALRNWDLADESVGTIGGRGKLWIEGASTAELLASADGGLVLLMAGGRLEALLVELAGLDAGQAFVSWIRRREPISIDCAYVDLQARNGVTKLDTAVVDTEDTTFTMGGQVDLNTERLDISIIAHPKDPSVVVGRSPLRLEGTFDNIETTVHSGKLMMRTGASAVLGGVAGPLAALLPLLDVGTGADTEYCQGLVRRSREAIQEGDDE